MEDNNIIRLRNQFLKYYHNSDYFNATLTGERLVAMYKSDRLRSGEEYGRDMFNLACTYEKDGRYDKALATYLKAADAVSKTGNSGKLSDIYNNIAIVYNSLHRGDMAMVYFKKCYNIRCELFPHDHPDVIAAGYNLGSMYRCQGRFGQAISCYSRALDSRRDKGVAYADNLYNLGMCYIEGDDMDRGLKYMQEALDIYRDITDNPGEYITALSFYTSILYKLGRYREALDSCNELIALIKKEYGSDQPFYADAISRLADCYASLDMTDKAIPIKQKAINMIKRSVGTDHLFYSTALSELGEYYLRSGEYEKAVPLYTKALETRTKILGIGEDECIDYIHTLTDIYIALDVPGKAEDLIKYALNNLQPDRERYSRLVLILVRLYMDTENGMGLNEAFKLFNKAYPEKSFDEMLDMAEDI